MPKYRIIMNGNGEFQPQRKTFLLWYGLEWESYGGTPSAYNNRLSDAFNARYAHWMSFDDSYGRPMLFKDSEVAIRWLIAAQEHDAMIKRSGKWSVVVSPKALEGR